MINRGLIEEADCPALNYQRLTKPLIEKRRRARINGCLGELKKMVIDSGKHPIQNPKCKYEKADILEITVDYLKNMHLRQELDNNISKESYSDGFKECIKQVEHFMKCIPLSGRLSTTTNANKNSNSNSNSILDHNLLSQKLLTHLDFCRHELTNIDNTTANLVELPSMELDNDGLNQLDSGYYDTRNLMSPNSFSVIHHTRDYSSSISSNSSSSSTKTMYSPPSSPEPLHRSFRAGEYRHNVSRDYTPDIEPRDMRTNSRGYYENKRNGQCYQLDADGVWRPW